jgi:hypothetical protein
VIVAVRLARLPTPEEKVKVAAPFVPVMTLGGVTTPVSVPKVIRMLGSAAFVELSAVTVTVVLAELSEGTLVGDAERVRVDTPPGVVAPLPLLGPDADTGSVELPQPVNARTAARQSAPSSALPVEKRPSSRHV